MTDKKFELLDFSAPMLDEVKALREKRQWSLQRAYNYVRLQRRRDALAVLQTLCERPDEDTVRQALIDLLHLLRLDAERDLERMREGF